MNKDLERALMSCVYEEINRKPYNKSHLPIPAEQALINALNEEINPSTKPNIFKKIIKYFKKVNKRDVLTIFGISVFGLFLGSILCWGTCFDTNHTLAGEVCYIDNKTNEVYVMNENEKVCSYYDEDAEAYNTGDFISVSRPRARKRNLTSTSKGKGIIINPINPIN